ncbi:hypothetical protein LCGC14_2334880 [marine sediment metagenome]|uniref:HNH nuclease domain-containing protein n=1 Tax=marine sediment metagenome TaxID=412755 RepID=A0A0F9CEL5_9ZZZZ
MRGKQHLLSSREKDVIRHSVCGQCKAEPIIENEEHCHPHRIIHGADGGLYTAANTVPRCPSCHDIEHGGDGTAPFIGAAREAGLKGNPKMWNDEVKERHRTATKKAMNCPEVRARHLVALALPERKARISASVKKVMAQPEMKAKHRAATRKALAHPQEKKRRSAAAKKAWKDPRTRARYCAAIKEAFGRPEMRVKMRRAAIKRSWIQRRKNACP